MTLPLLNRIKTTSLWRLARWLRYEGLGSYPAFEFRFTELYVSFWAGLLLRSRKHRVVGITGSVGKTTTQEMVAAVLTHPEAQSIVGSVFKGTMNGRIGLPMSVLGYPREAFTTRERAKLLLSAPLRALAKATHLQDCPTILLLEYGMSAKGYITQRAKLARPEIAVVTAVGPAHLTYFNSLERVAKEKGALVRAVPGSGLVVLAQDNEYVSKMAQETKARVVQVPGTGLELARGIARVVGSYFGLPEEIIDCGLNNFQPPPGRLNMLELGAIRVIDDSYNANPLSMKLGLDTLAETAGEGQRKIAVVGEMGELGEQSIAYHEEIGAYAHERADIIIGVGDLAQHYQPDHWMDSSARCRDELPALIHRDDCIFVKGSHSVHLDIVVDALKQIAEEINQPITPDPDS